MKILSLKLRNLNSLVGRWSVDFTDKAFAHSGIFAITGPTGAGKSTLLDAICLALYGQTPRLGKITQKENEIMSRHTGACDAEVTFSCNSGVYTCKWHQHRARNNPSGRLGNATHEISDAKGKLLSNKLSEVPEVVTQKTGLSFERFSRSVMLAQGRFGAFLEAGANDRAPILEQITGTEIYSDISIAIHERNRMEIEKLKALEEQQATAPLMDEAIRAEKQEAVTALQAQLEALTSLQEELQSAVAWRQRMASLANEIGALEKQAALILEAKAAFEPKRRLLDRAKKAASLAADYQKLVLTRRQKTDSQDVLLKLREKLPAISDNVVEITNRVSKCRLQLDAERAGQAADQLLQQTVRALDVQLATLTRQVDAANREQVAHRERLKLMQQQTTSNLKELQSVRQAAEQHREWQKKHEVDGTISQVIGAIDAHIGQLVILDEDLEGHKMTRQNGSVQVDKAAQRAAALRQQQESATETCAKKELEIQRQRQRMDGELAGIPLSVYRDNAKSLHEKRRLTERILQLEDERRRLKNGEPCPLCGATEHPFATAKLPELTPLDKEIDELENFIEAIVRDEAALVEDRDALYHLQQVKDTTALQTEKALAEHGALRDRLVQIEKEIAKLAARRTELVTGLRHYLSPLFGDTSIAEGGGQTVLDALKERARIWSDTQKVVAEANGREETLLLRQKEVDIAKAEIEQHMAGISNRLSQLVAEQQALQQERRDKYGDKSLEKETESWRRKVNSAEEALQLTQHNLNAAQTEQARLEATLEKLASDITGFEKELNALIPDFKSQWEHAGFADEADYVSARLPDAEMAALERAWHQLNDNEKSVGALQADRSRRLEAEKERRLSESDERTLLVQLTDTKTMVASQSETLGAIRQMLQDDARRRAEIDAVRRHIDAQKRECQKWQQMYDLIGSADGKKYRNFAQSLTLRRLLAHANIQLSRMTDRYLLHPDASEPLEFCIVDNHQAGEFRSTRNLSGGESFIVSLSLALGLAQMSSRKVQIDSLFLDEGFGSLDDAALETALDALSTLQQEGKLTGIISHVPALRDRILCRIQVVPRGGGISCIEGPGCQEGPNS